MLRRNNIKVKEIKKEIKCKYLIHVFSYVLVLFFCCTYLYADDRLISAFSCETDLCKFVDSVIKYENRNLTTAERLRIAKAITYASLDRRFLNYGLDQISSLCLLLGIAKIESNFNPYAVSHKKAVGVKQIHIPTWKISYREAFDINFNILLGKEILLHYLNKSGGNLYKALCMYYGACRDGYPEKVERKYRFYKNVFYKVFFMN